MPRTRSRFEHLPCLEGRRVLVAISGGIDSAVATFMLIQQGAEVAGLYIDMSGRRRDEDSALDSAERIASAAGIELLTINAANKFRHTVIRYFTDEYMNARTPNPCVICNPEIKFHIGMQTVESCQFDFFATGHYANTCADRITGRFTLRMGRDRKKDQSYFLHRLHHSTLARSIFPLGCMFKTEVRDMAERFGISSMMQPESQEICFLDNDYRSFLDELFRHDIDGPILTVDGKEMGRHRGLHRYTIGQRRGLGIPDTTPYYVIALDHSSNSLIIGKEQDLMKSTLLIEEVVWIANEPPASSFNCTVKIRYRHQGAKAFVAEQEEGRWRIAFDAPQKAVTPGQYAVIYDRDLVLGGGKICG